METQHVPGEAFRRSVSRALEALDQVRFLSPETRETLTSSAARLCLVEAVAEQKALALAERAKAEWEVQGPVLKASFERFVAELFDAPAAPSSTVPPTATAEPAADSPQTPPSADGKPEA
jgi:hypothetical protein